MHRSKPTIGIIGVGSIAAAIVTGIMRAERDTPIILSPRGAQRAAALAARFPSVTIAADNQAVVDGCDVVLVCVLPRDADAVLRAARFRPDHTVISAVAGVRMATLRPSVAPATPCRAIPLPAVAEGNGPTPIHPADDRARLLFDLIGGGIELASEAQFDAFAAATGTISAHIAYLATVADWLGGQGVPQADADRYVAGMFSALNLVPHPPEELRDLARHHMTPGGLNEAFAAMLAGAGLPEATRSGLDRLLDRLTHGA